MRLYRYEQNCHIDLPNNWNYSSSLNNVVGLMVNGPDPTQNCMRLSSTAEAWVSSITKLYPIDQWRIHRNFD